jgi:hypothetical protein
MPKKVNKLKRWSYGIRKEPSDLGPYVCDIYFGLTQIDYHTCIFSRKEAEKVGKTWVNFLEKCDAKFRYDSVKYPKWIDWYSIAYGKSLSNF